MQVCQGISVNFPLGAPVETFYSAQAGFSVEAQGIGSFSGLSYTVPAHTKGNIMVDVQVMAITSEDVKKLNDLVISMLNASEKQKIENYSRTHVSADISIWSIFGGGASAGYEKTNYTMHSMGLTDDQISTIINELFNIASKMSNVRLDFTVDNSEHDYSVSGDLQLYTVSGRITTSKGTAEYRFLANNGTAGSEEEKAPVNGEIIKLH